MSSKYELHKGSVYSVLKKHAEINYKNLYLRRIVLFRYNFAIGCLNYFYLLKKRTILKHLN